MTTTTLWRAFVAVTGRVMGRVIVGVGSWKGLVSGTTCSCGGLSSAIFSARRIRPHRSTWRPLGRERAACPAVHPSVIHQPLGEDEIGKASVMM